MPTVWIRETTTRVTRFHRSPDCWQLRKKPAQGEPRELVAKDLAEVGVRPCRSCYPDAPDLKVLKRRCEICQSPYACEHNGGVLVTTRAGWQRWVWPDTNQMPYYRRVST